MAGAASRLEGGSPNSEDQTRIIECSPFLLQDLRAAVLEQFNRLPHGGAELFGVLFGSRQGRDMQITAFRALGGEIGRTGPALSEQDRAVFRSILDGAQNDEEIAAIEPVGWFRAHPRSDLALAERDLEIFNSLFKQPWQVALILKPGNSVPSRGRVFFREPDGSLRAEGGFREFTHATEHAPAANGNPIAPETALAALQSVLVPATALSAPPSSIQPEASQASEEVSLLASAKCSAEPAGDSPLSEIAQPQTLPGPTAHHRLGTFLATALAAAVILLSFFYWRAQKQELSLSVADSSGQLRITWNREANSVQAGRHGQLEITDGAQKFRVELDPEQLRGGAAIYARRSGDVTVRLRVGEPDAQAVEQAVHLSLTAPSGALRKSGRSGDENDSRSRVAQLPPKLAEFVVSVPVDPGTEPNRTLTLPSTLMPSSQSVNKVAPELAAPPAMEAHNAVNLPAALPPPVHAAPPIEKPVQVSTASANTNTTATNTPALPATAARPPALQASGRVIWIGRLQKSDVLTISGKSSSTGTVIGELPGRPVKVSISPGDLSADGIVLYTSNLQYANNVIEPPRAENGWNKTIYTWNPRYANDITMPEAPGPQNGWSRMVLRSKNPKLSVIVIDWALVN